MQSSSCFLFLGCAGICVCRLLQSRPSTGSGSGLVIKKDSSTSYTPVQLLVTDSSEVSLSSNCIPIELPDFNFPLLYFFFDSIYISRLILTWALHKMCFIRSWWKKASNPGVMTVTPRLSLTLKVAPQGLPRWICLCPAIQLSLKCGLIIFSCPLYKSIPCPV